MRLNPGIGLIALALGGCGESRDMQSKEASKMVAYDVQEAAPADGAKPGLVATRTAEPIEVAVPRIAYVYKLGLVAPGGAIARMQQDHVALCDRLGPTRCQLVGMQRSSAEAGYASGSLKLRVESGIARGFLDQLGKAAAGAGGRAIDTTIEAEDVAKQIVDANARIAQRTLLVARLTEILRTRQGSVGDLVAAERAVAQAQEELDQAKGWLSELSTRVALSTIDISYNAQAPETGGFGERIGDSLANSGSVFITGLQALLTVLIFLVPWAILLVPLALLLRGWRKRRHARREAASD